MMKSCDLLTFKIIFIAYLLKDKRFSNSSKLRTHRPKDLKCCIFQVPLEKWISFELSAAWGEVPLDVRLTYLQLRVRRDFVGESGGCADLTLGDAIVKMVFVLMEVGLKKVCLDFGVFCAS